MTETTTSIKRNPVDGAILSISQRVGGSKAKEVERFLKFAVVGVMGFIVDLTTLIVLQATILPPTNRLNVAVATSLAFLAAILSNFTWNRFWTYPDSRTRTIRRQLTQFIIVSVIGWGARTAWISAAYLALGQFFTPILMPLLESILPTFAASPDVTERMGSMIAQVIGVIVIMFWNFFANRYWTYADVDAAENLPEQQ